MTELDLDVIRGDLEYASSGIDGGDMPYHPHALAAMRAAEKLLAEVERLRQLYADHRAVIEAQAAEITRLRATGEDGTRDG